MAVWPYTGHSGSYGREPHKLPGQPILGEGDLAKMMNWPRQLLAIQTAVSAAGDDLDRVLGIVLQNARPHGLLRRRRRDRIARRAMNSSAARPAAPRPGRPATRTPVAGIVPGFCSISAQDRDGLKSSINAPIPFKGEHVGLLQTPFPRRERLLEPRPAGAATARRARHAGARPRRALAGRARAAPRPTAASRRPSTRPPVGISIVSPDGRFMMVNDKFCAYRRVGPRGADCPRLPGHHPSRRSRCRPCPCRGPDRRADRSSYAMEKRYIRSDGSPVWINLTVALIRKPDGSPDFFVSVIEDISARRAAEIDAVHDPLTGLLNRARRAGPAQAGDGPAGRVAARRRRRLHRPRRVQGRSTTASATTRATAA